MRIAISPLTRVQPVVAKRQPDADVTYVIDVREHSVHTLAYAEMAY